MASQNKLSTLNIILNSWKSAIKEVVFTFEIMYIYRISSLRFGDL